MLTPLLIGGFLIVLVGTGMLLLAAFSVSRVWGVLCLAVPPLQAIFALLHWKKSWDAVLLLVMGFGMLLVFFLQAEQGFSLASVESALVQMHRESGLAQRDSGPVTVQEETVQSVTVPETVEVGSAPGSDVASVGITAAPEKARNDKPIYKCTDPWGNETWSAEPCKGGVIKGGGQPEKKPQ